MSNLSIYITATIDPKNRDKFFETFLPFYQEITALPGCTFFEVYESPENPGEISWMENWSLSVDEVLAILHQDKYKPAFETLLSFLVKPRETKILNRIGEPYTYRA
ncbi:hypothetical protein BDV18DRAFT_145107 [Aspergillus unguis]